MGFIFGYYFLLIVSVLRRDVCVSMDTGTVYIYISDTIWITCDILTANASFCVHVIKSKICHLTWAITFREVWEETMGDSGSFWVALCNMLKPALANLAYVHVKCFVFVFVLIDVYNVSCKVFF